MDCILHPGGCAITSRWVCRHIQVGVPIHPGGCADASRWGHRHIQVGARDTSMHALTLHLHLLPVPVPCRLPSQPPTACPLR